MESNAPRRDIVSFLARLLGGGAVLALLISAIFNVTPYAASVASSVTQAAATWLGDQQGVPKNYLGRVYPDYTSCQYGDPNINPCVSMVEDWPLFSPDNWPPAAHRTFYSAVLSISQTKAAAGTYPTNTYEPTHWEKTADMGPGGYHRECTGGGETPVECNDYYDRCPAPAPPAQYVQVVDLNTYGYFSNPNYDPYHPNDPGKGPYECWGQRLAEEYPDPDGNNPTEPGQTAYAQSSYSIYTPIKNLGPATQVVDPVTQATTWDCSAYTPSVSTDKVIAVQPKSGFAYVCWQARANPSHIVHNDPVLKGAVPSVNPGAPLTLQWSCLPSHTAVYRYRDCTYYPGGQHCGDWHTPTEYTIDPLFTGASSPDFAASALRGTKQFAAPAKPGLYDYTLTCQGPKPLVLSVSIRVKNTGPACQKAEILDLGTGAGAKIADGGAWEVKATVGDKDYDFCIDNKTTQDFFVPLGSEVEADSFLNSVNSASGLGDGTTDLEQVW